MRNWFIILMLLGLFYMWSCRTEIPFDPGPIEPEPMDSSAVNPGDTIVNPGDTTANPGDTSTVDTMSMQPCDTSIVYFQSDILPILQGNCAFAGCHDPVSAQHGLVLDSYENLMSHGDLITPFDLDDSELYEKITEDDVEDRMPPPPNAALSQDQILLIGKWILQGAENNSCEMSGGCDTSAVSFSSDVAPIFSTYCVTCHGNVNPNGGVILSSYNGVSAVAKSGKLLGVVSWANGFLRMPLGGNQIPACDVNTIEAWINQGVLNN